MFLSGKAKSSVLLNVEKITEMVSDNEAPVYPQQGNSDG